jgi:hypothetical protein
MGLRERKLLAAIREGALITYQQRIREELGYDLLLDFDSASFEHDAEACQSLEQFISFVVIGLMSVGNDAVGKAALAEHVHAVMIVNVKDAAEKAITLADKTLTLHVAMSSSDSSGRMSSAEIETWLLNNLD